MAKIGQGELKPNQIHRIMPDLAGNDALNSLNGHLQGSGSLELAPFHQRTETSIELADKWPGKCCIEAKSGLFQSNIGLL